MNKNVTDYELLTNIIKNNCDEVQDITTTSYFSSFCIVG